MDRKEFMDWLRTVPHNDEPFCPFPLGGYCDNPLSEDCAHCVFCPMTDSTKIEDLIY